MVKRLRTGPAGPLSSIVVHTRSEPIVAHKNQTSKQVDSGLDCPLRLPGSPAGVHYNNHACPPACLLIRNPAEIMQLECVTATCTIRFRFQSTIGNWIGVQSTGTHARSL